MFFPRLRRHAKWVFVLLALVMGLGFVIFGVGAGGTGIGDIFRNGGATGGSPSVSRALDATEKNPADPDAWRELATAYQTEGKTTEAIDALIKLTTLRATDTDALRELASLYLGDAGEKSYQARLAQYASVYRGGSSVFSPAIAGKDGSPVFTNKITAQIDAITSARIQELQSGATTGYSQAVSAYKRIAALSGSDPNVQLELAQAAQQAGDYTTAVAAYKKHLRLAPESSTTAAVKEQIKLLESALQGAG
jgi:tetratricopeptide (TPR) repeat protein